MNLFCDEMQLHENFDVMKRRPRIHTEQPLKISLHETQPTRLPDDLQHNETWRGHLFDDGWIVRTEQSTLTTRLRSNHMNTISPS